MKIPCVVREQLRHGTHVTWPTLSWVTQAKAQAAAAPVEPVVYAHTKPQVVKTA